LPEPTVEVVEVDMNAEQAAKYDRYVQQIEAALESGAPGKAWEEEDDVDIEHLEAAPWVESHPAKADHRPEPRVAPRRAIDGVKRTQGVHGPRD